MSGEPLAPNKNNSWTVTLSIYLKGSLPLNQPPRAMIIFYSQPRQVSCDGVSVFRATAITLYLSCQHLKASLFSFRSSNLAGKYPPTYASNCVSIMWTILFRILTIFLSLLFSCFWFHLLSSLSSVASFPISWTVVTRLLLIQYLFSLYP